MPNTYREVKVWSGTAWESLAIAFPDLSVYAKNNTANSFAGVQTFNDKVLRPEQIPFNIEVGTVNLTTTTSGDSLIIGSKAFDVGRFTQVPIVLLTVYYPTTVKNGYATVKSVNTNSFVYEVNMSVPVTDGQAPNYPLKVAYQAIQMTA